ncbi:beta-glucosidase BglX [Parvularcula lutaonensis]|uniref:Beta-glucosidase BglX n=1 Tax=Parvularcula lutaonensis TaxID=491923 RepID=A0ABV7MCS5_9PROT|nr:beta-glucosidase BglX [Parvularcula lutaonensis]GGY37872.1 glycosyl hydrolase [Parvularcula lutaonensis]
MKAILAAGTALLSSSLLAGALAQDTAAEKAEALLQQMTLEEKVGQLTQYSEAWDVTGPAPTGDVAREKFEHVETGMVGSMLNVIGAERVRKIQDYAVENSRLGIPMIFAYDVIHGHKTAFPIPLAEAASWDLEMIELSARIAAREAAAQGLNWTFAPMVDISRDPRWGRVMEGAGEDPYLGSKIAVARVRGFQGEDLSDPLTIAATAKHFAAYGFAEAGKDYNAADIGTVTLWNVVFPPFKAAIDDANVRTVMNAFNTLNGIPATADEWLQRDVLKGKWDFDGFVISDWGSAVEMIDHGVAADREDAAFLAMKAGSDMDMESYVYRDHLKDLVEAGKIDEELVDDAVRRVLTVKYELGLFDDPYRYIDEGREASLLFTDEHREASLKMAERSVVLLKNEGSLLPLKEGESIALIGALAADKDSPLGNWRGQAEKGSAVSLMEGFEAAGIDFTYAEGAAVETGDAGFATEVEVNLDDRSGFAEAVEAAQSADKVVIVLGEDALQSGEGRSRADLGFPGVQQELLEAVHAANPNTILVVMSGRPLILTWADENVPAIVQAWHLGHEGGHALTNVLTGAYNPSGKLPMTFPRSVGQIPIYYNHLNTGRPGPRDVVFWQHYIDESNDPLYPFGHGLSYTEFDYSRLRVRNRGDQVEVSVRVRNTGDVEGEEVVQLYIRDRVASIARPVRELKGFEKVSLKPGEARRVSFTLTDEELGFYGPRGDYRVEPGAFDVFVGGSSEADLTATFELSRD